MKISEYLSAKGQDWQTIKALSVRQPFASQIVVGEKTIEWRSKPFNYRGPLVICASSTAKIKMGNGKLLPIGVALGLVEIVGCRPMTKKDLYAACCEDYKGVVDGYAWILERPVETIPVPIKGIVAPWPWANRGSIDLEICERWHDSNVLVGLV